MAIATAKSVFLHTPKCAGTFVKRVLEASGLRPTLIGEQHEHFPKLLAHAPEEYFLERYVFTFVRHPATWYQSQWAFRVKTGWHAKHPLDWNTASNNFQQWVRNVLAYRPDGWCTWLFSSYIRNRYVKFVGRQEFAATDLMHAMQQAGEPLDPAIVAQCGLVNSSASSQLALYTPSLLDRVLAVENTMIQRYYRNFELDRKALCE